MELAVFPPYVAEVTKEPAADTEGRLGGNYSRVPIRFPAPRYPWHRRSQPWTSSSLKPFMLDHAMVDSTMIVGSWQVLALRRCHRLHRRPSAPSGRLLDTLLAARRANAVHGEPDSVGSGWSTLLQHGKAKASAAFMGRVFGRKD